MTLATGPESLVLAILGPTASGKTALAVELAQRLGGELLNADSRQAVAEMEVGVGKPTPAELGGVACHGLDWAHLGETFSAAVFRRRAAVCVWSILGRGRPALVVGGSGLYVRGLLAGFDYGRLESDQGRGGLLEAHAGLDRDPVRALQLADPGRASRIDLHNQRRVVRALDLARAGVEARQQPPPWTVVKLGCRLERQELRRRIRLRAERMLGAGLVREIQRLLRQGYSRQELAAAAIGYSEALDWMDGRVDREGAVSRVALRTARYAKAQSTWLRRERDVQWVDLAETVAETADRCLEIMAAVPAPN